MEITIDGNGTSIQGNEAIERFITAVADFTTEIPEAEITLTDISFVFNYKEDDQEQITDSQV